MHMLKALLLTKLNKYLFLVCLRLLAPKYVPFNGSININTIIENCKNKQLFK